MPKRLATIAVCSLMLFPGLSADGDEVVIDGMLDDAYSLSAVQTVQTGFGNNLSEWNAAYTHYDASTGILNMMLTGNLEANFNKLEIFIDSRPGGENTLSSLPEYDFFNGAGWISTNMDGMTFDDGFAPDFHLFARTGGTTFEVDFVDRLGGTSASVNGNAGEVGYNGAFTSGVGIVSIASLANNAVAGALQNDISFAMDNSNTAGVGGNQGVAANHDAALAVKTGFEFAIHVDDLGIDPRTGGQIKVSVLQNNGDHNYLSNQFLGGLPIGTGNLGGDGSGNFTGTLLGINLNNFDGEQFFTLDLPGHLLSDLNSNGFVDFEDLTILLANWNKDATADDGNLVEPLTTVVNFADLTVLLADWTGPGPAGSPEAALGEAVPEPSSLLLALLATLGLSFYRRRRRRAF